MFNKNMPRTLSEVLQQWPSPPNGKVLALPIAHLTSLKSFRETMENEKSELKPKNCRVFNRELLYFSYGTVSHRYKNLPINNLDWCPVALLFTPRLLKQIDCFFPYDTGAACKGLLGDLNQDLNKFDTYRISNDGSFELPSKFIYHVYGSNEKYLEGEPVSEYNPILQIDPVITLINFLREDLTDLGVDHRQRSMECQTSEPISLKDIFDQILWVGMPHRECGVNGVYEKLCRLSNPVIPIKKYAYKFKNGQRPDEITAILEEKAREFVQEFLDLQIEPGNSDTPT